MAIAASRLHYEVRKKINRVNSDWSKSVSVPEVDAYLNEAKDLIYENYAALVETNQTIRNHLRQVEVKKVCLPCEKVDKRCCKITYPTNFYALINQHTIACRAGCEEEILVTKIVQSNEVDQTFNDPYNKPSWQWRETIADEAGDGLYVYYDRKKGLDQFEVKEVCINYLRKIKDIATPSLSKKGSYINASGQTVNEDSDFEIDSTYIWRKVVSVAALLIQRDIGDIRDYQTQLQAILAVDKIYMQ